MVVREDGSKWACTSCLKGHRVSGCNHTDRELHLVPKKGRPVTQCQHCRQERKKRSAHVSCDCAATDKPHHSKEKCIHLREAEERAKNANYFDDQIEKDFAHLASVAEEQGCCCSHGGKCSCALTRKGSEGDCHMGPAVKPRLESTKSDGSITVFANGHHKPVHRKNHAAHESGMPYKMPLARSKTDQNMATRRSVDSLALTPEQYNSQAIQLQQLAKSGSISPSRLQADLFAEADGLTSDRYGIIDFSDLNLVRTNESLPSATGDMGLNGFDDMSTLLESPFDGWTGMQELGVSGVPNAAFSAWPTTSSMMAQPALTAASSGTQSEIDEIPTVEDAYTHGMPSIQELGFEMGNPLTTNSPQTNRRSLPPGFFGNIDFTTTPVESDWQATEEFDKGITPLFNDPWQSMNGAERRAYPTSYASAGRPVARSVGPGSAPSADIMKQLFPDMDVEIGANTNMQARARAHDLSNSISVSDEDDAYIAQAWNDGSLSVPVDGFNMQYSQQYNQNWAQ